MTCTRAFRVLIQVSVVGRRWRGRVESVGQYLKRARLERGVSIGELARVTRVPERSIVSLETDRFDELPGEVFVRGFLRAYARALSMSVDDLLARYTSSRRVAQVALPPSVSRAHGRSKKFGVAIGLTVLLIVFTLALSIAVARRARTAPSKLSSAELALQQRSA
jgi:cytoskeletal protein RodZ